MAQRRWACLVALLPAAALALCAWGLGAGADEAPKGGKPKFSTEPLRGRAVWMDDALKTRFGIDSDADARHTLVALLTPEGRLHPIVKDFRGRAFHVDPRLHDIDLEVLVRRYEGSPMVQVVRIYTLKEEGKYEFDYWCDICAISMYELKPCECCQGPIRIRERLIQGEPK